MSRLVNVALRILDDRDAPEFEELIESIGARGVSGEFKALVAARFRTLATVTAMRRVQDSSDGH